MSKKFGKIIFVVAIGVALYMVFFQFSELKRIVKLIVEINLFYLFFAVVVQIVRYFIQGYYFKYVLRLYQKDASLVALTKISVVNTFIMYTVPSFGIASIPLFTSLKKSRVTKGEAAVLSFSYLALFYVTFIVLLFAGFFILLFDNQVSFGQLIPVGIVTIALFILTLVGYTASKSKEKLHDFLQLFFGKIFSKIPFVGKRHEEFRLKSELFLDELWDASAVLKKRRYGLVVPFILTTIIHIFDLMTLFVLLLNFDYVIPLSVLVVGFCLANIATMVSGVPMGIGVFEASMALTYAGLGVPFDPILVSVLVYRFLAFWLLLPIGTFLYQRILNKWTFVKRQKK